MSRTFPTSSVSFWQEIRLFDQTIIHPSGPPHWCRWGWCVHPPFGMGSSWHGRGCVLRPQYCSANDGAPSTAYPGVDRCRELLWTNLNPQTLRGQGIRHHSSPTCVQLPVSPRSSCSPFPLRAPARHSLVLSARPLPSLSRPGRVPFPLRQPLPPHPPVLCPVPSARGRVAAARISISRCS